MFHEIWRQMNATTRIIRGGKRQAKGAQAEAMHTKSISNFTVLESRAVSVKYTIIKLKTLERP